LVGIVKKQQKTPENTHTQTDTGWFCPSCS